MGLTKKQRKSISDNFERNFNFNKKDFKRVITEGKDIVCINFFNKDVNYIHKVLKGLLGKDIIVKIKEDIMTKQLKKVDERFEELIKKEPMNIAGNKALAYYWFLQGWKEALKDGR